LATLPLGAGHHRDDVCDKVHRESSCDDLWFIETFNDQEVQDLIQNLVVGKAVLVGLAWS
jgi:hypothetical protein